jgi:tetratricopeptide (TPR) repeat protein
MDPVNVAATRTLLRPQPLGIFPFPAGLLLLPPSHDSDAPAALATLMRGGVPDTLPESWAFYGHAVNGDRDAAAALLNDDSSAIAAYNRFVLTGDYSALERAREDDRDAVVRLAELAAFVQGARDEAPEDADLDHELLAVARMARAAQHLEHEETEPALVLLRDGAEAARGASPVLAAQLLAQAAQLAEAHDHELAIKLWRDAVRLVGESPLAQLKSELLLGLALALHAAADGRRGALTEVVQLYQAALYAGITLEGTPETYALVQSNIGLAYVSMPMTDAGDKIRHAVAVSSFREALKVYTREAFPEQWTSTMLNMANALQYLDSSHREENLMLAVDTYEELLAVRNKAYDPAGYGRLLANQANALAHLGVFAPALEKFNEAYKLLHWHGEGELAHSILEQVERINVQIGAAPGATPAVTDAIHDATPN